MIHGIDVSAYQPAAYSTAGLDFVFTKITEGLTYTNPLWVQQRERARKAGLVWGAYHYPHMGNDPRAEADRFLGKVAWRPGDLIVLDWEGYDSANKDVSHARQLAYRDAWLKYVKAKMPGHRVGMYANTDYWKYVDQTSNCGDFLWIATAGRPAGSPGIEHPWLFHQYSTAGGIDHDVANFPSRAALAAWAAGTTPEQEDDMTPEQARQLAELHNRLLPYMGWNYKGSERRDAWGLLNDVTAEVAGIKAKVDSLSVGGVDLDALATRVADLLAARLAE